MLRISSFRVSSNSVKSRAKHHPQAQVINACKVRCEARRTLLTHVVVEDLTRIRNASPSAKNGGTKNKTANRKINNNFPFALFQYHLAYKLRKRGIDFVKVDPAYTSQECSVCHNIDKASRKTQTRFVCTACESALNAENNASVNILARGLRKLGIDAGRYSSTNREPVKPRRRAKEDTMLRVV